MTFFKIILVDTYGDISFYDESTTLEDAEKKYKVGLQYLLEDGGLDESGRGIHLVQFTVENGSLTQNTLKFVDSLVYGVDKVDDE